MAKWEAVRDGACGSNHRCRCIPAPLLLRRTDPSACPTTCAPSCQCRTACSSSGGPNTSVRRGGRRERCGRVDVRRATPGRPVALGCIHVNPLESLLPVPMDDFAPGARGFELDTANTAGIVALVFKDGAGPRPCVAGEHLTAREARRAVFRSGGVVPGPQLHLVLRVQLVHALPAPRVRAPRPAVLAVRVYGGGHGSADQGAWIILADVLYACRCHRRPCRLRWPLGRRPCAVALRCTARPRRRRTAVVLSIAAYLPLLLFPLRPLQAVGGR